MQVNSLRIKYNKKEGTVSISNQGYDTSIYNAEDLFKAVEQIKKGV